MRRQFTGRLAEYGEDDDEREVFHFEDGREREFVCDTPLQRGLLKAAVAAAAVLGLAALLAA
ncbi:MAG TPA: hypothetical protein VJL84_03245 [Kiloniellales bacterium]|nr:hypothetical protein [Kiloniellales bacterium]